MKVIILLLSCVAIATAYDDLDDDFYGKLLDNKNELEAFFKCLVDQGPCNTEFGARAKTHMAEFFADGCNECDLRQKHYSHLMLLVIKNDYPDLYQALEDKFDPKKNADNIDAKMKSF